jgi:hypothetical protein
MKSYLLTIVAAGSVFFAAAQLHSQAPAAAAAKTPLELLQTMKAQNQALLEKQTATMVKLDELQKDAAQIRFMAKRS